MKNPESNSQHQAIEHPSFREGLGGLTLSLLELNGLVRELIETAMPGDYWVEAELSECRENRGHCYMELIQRDDRTNTPVARASAKCWASKWMLIRPYFERTTGQPLRAGLKVLLCVHPQFHEAYGFSWIVTDIDPNYTLGDQARRRQEIIRRLKDEGVFDLQRELRLPLICLNIAVVSSQTAAGYGDFAAQLADSNFAFRSQLFPATMQGEGVEQSIISALNMIYTAPPTAPEGASIVGKHITNSNVAPSGAEGGAYAFDCVVIIRGGGATSDLSGFDTLALAENVANFPIPIITGIGHDRDESILDMVSHRRVKTPTAAAAFLIDHAQAVYDALNDAQNRVAHHTQQKLAILNSRLSILQEAIPRLFSVVKTRQEARLDQLSARLLAQTQQAIIGNRNRIDAIGQRMPMVVERRLTSERHKLELATERLKVLDPNLLLRRGYSITLMGGHAVRDPKRLHPGDQIETRLEKGTVKSIIT